MTFSETYRRVKEILGDEYFTMSVRATSFSNGSEELQCSIGGAGWDFTGQTPEIALLALKAARLNNKRGFESAINEI